MWDYGIFQRFTMDPLTRIYCYCYEFVPSWQKNDVNGIFQGVQTRVHKNEIMQ